MAELERDYNVPLRKEFLKVPKYKRSKKAVMALKQFITKHMKAESVVISEKLNEHIWKDGIKSPPHHVKVTATKDKDGKVSVDLESAKKEAPKAPIKKAPAKEVKETPKAEEATKTEKPKEEVKEKAPAKKVVEEKSETKSEEKVEKKAPVKEKSE